MIPEPYWTIGKHILLISATWMLASIPGIILLNFWQRNLTESLSETARKMWSFGPGGFTAYDYFRTSLAAAYAALGAHSVRVVLERKHKELRQALDSIRQVLDRRVQQIAAASAGTDGGSLIDLLRGFRADVDRALEFGMLEDGFVDDTVKRKKALLYIVLCLLGVILLSAVNFGLLYLYFSESTEGQRIPYLGIDLALGLALLLPGVELCSGIGAKLIEEMESFGKYLLLVGAALVLVALGSWEYTIFYLLFEGQFEQMMQFEQGGLMHQLTSAVGPGLTFLQSLFGYMVMKYVGEWRELRTHQTIRDQIGDANRFVGGLESRYGAIERASSAACHSLDEFANQLSGRGQAELPVASAIAEQRETLRAAIDEVSPERWPAFTAGSDSEQKAVKAQAWVLALLSLATIGLFTWAAAPTIARSEIFDLDSFFVSTLIACGTGVVCFVAGMHLFDRTTIAYETQSHWRDAISPRDVVYRLAAATVLLVAILGIAWVCFDVSGLAGMSRALMLIGLLIGIAVCGSYNDLVGQGFGFLWQGIVAIARFILATLKYVVWGLLILLVALAAGFIHLVIAVVAWPMTLLLAYLRRTKEEAQGRPGPVTS